MEADDDSRGRTASEADESTNAKGMSNIKDESFYHLRKKINSISIPNVDCGIRSRRTHIDDCLREEKSFCFYSFKLIPSCTFDPTCLSYTSYTYLQLH